MQGNKNKIIFLFLVSLLLAYCNRDRNNPGWDYFPDMAYSTAYESYTPNPNFNDGMTMRVPPDGTVPRGFEPFGYTIAPESRIKAGEELINPIMPSDAALQRGKEIFTTFCIDCHGASGEGDGHLYTSGLYPVKPRSLVAPEAKALKDGEIYHTITLGFGAMGAHGSQVRPEDRWKVILYIRNLQEESGNLSDKNEGGNK